MITDIFNDYEYGNHYFLGLDPGLIDILHLRNQDGKFEFVIKSTKFQASENPAKKKTDKWRAHSNLFEINKFIQKTIKQS